MAQVGTASANRAVKRSFIPVPRRKATAAPGLSNSGVPPASQQQGNAAPPVQVSRTVDSHQRQQEHQRKKQHTRTTIPHKERRESHTAKRSLNPKQVSRKSISSTLPRDNKQFKTCKTTSCSKHDDSRATSKAIYKGKQSSDLPNKGKVPTRRSLSVCKKSTGVCRTFKNMNKKVTGRRSIKHTPAFCKPLKPTVGTTVKKKPNAGPAAKDPTEQNTAKMKVDVEPQSSTSVKPSINDETELMELMKRLPTFKRSAPGLQSSLSRGKFTPGRGVATLAVGGRTPRRQKDEDELELEQLVQLMATTRRPRPNTQQENSSMSAVANAPTPKRDGEEELKEMMKWIVSCSKTAKKDTSVKCRRYDIGLPSTKRSSAKKKIRDYSYAQRLLLTPLTPSRNPLAEINTTLSPSANTVYSPFLTDLCNKRAATKPTKSSVTAEEPDPIKLCSQDLWTEDHENNQVPGTGSTTMKGQVLHQKTSVVDHPRTHGSSATSADLFQCLTPLINSSLHFCPTDLSDSDEGQTQEVTSAI